MDTPTRSQSPSTHIHLKTEQTSPVQDKISAYYSLVFPHFTFYVQTLSVTIGRRCAPNPHAASSSTAEPVHVDVDLGALKSVSRLHAKIEYDHDEDRFILVVIGRNGAWVDGVWCASGTHTPLSECSQIQIASRVFQFILPPPPPPEDSPSPSSHSSGATRHRSPSLDIETISPPSSQPPNSPPLIEHKLPSPPPEPRIKREMQSQPKLPNSNVIGKSTKATINHPAANTKKRKKGDADAHAIIERPRPEDMPPKPPFTYAQLIYKAIKSIGGKATLQEICTWISRTYDYYKYADSSWMSSVRHNLSSGRAFLKMERCGGERGKGFFWSVDEKHARALEEQETKAQQAASGGAHSSSGGKDGTTKGRKKDKGALLLGPPLKRSIKGDSKGIALPPPLTNTPLALKTATPTTVQYGSTLTTNHSGPNPYATLAQNNWSMHRPMSGLSTESSGASTATPTTNPGLPTHRSMAGSSRSPQSLSTGSQSRSESIPVSAEQHKQPMVPDVVIPIVLGPIPPSHSDYSPSHRNNSAKEGYMVLHERKLILDPDVFSELTPEMLVELEKMGARAALTVLTGHMVRALKEKRVRERGKSKEKRRAKGSRKGAPAALAGDPAKSCHQDPSDLRGDEEIGETLQASPMEPVDAASPLIVVDDSDDEGPAAKKRKVGPAAVAAAAA
ncbi:hypothetical protein M378DRAFT_72467 [Amanita muscaria Koide BX008]|uniref:Uncharacterized protein n=1 Tax=Amanita muscaria (strain Koide BX008) TaxID=946122 RepID=A0A0C2TM72_AMAMK|nr:hypothetical protein M378DRAFT_72467 [Amanita muscaria Koide BX008]